MSEKLDKKKLLNWLDAQRVIAKKEKATGIWVDGYRVGFLQMNYNTIELLKKGDKDELNYLKKR